MKDFNLKEETMKVQEQNEQVNSLCNDRPKVRFSRETWNLQDEVNVKNNVQF